MAVKIRLARMGSKKRPYYRIVAADARSPRDGRFLERIGTYDPLHLDAATHERPRGLERQPGRQRHRRRPLRVSQRRPPHLNRRDRLPE